MKSSASCSTVLRAVIVVLAVWCLRKAKADTANITGDSSKKPFRLLFVGNSIFFTNGGVNHVVARLLQEQFPQEAIQATEIAEPNLLLRQHLEKAWIPGTKQFEALSTNSTAQWDVVIFQEETQQMAMGGEDAAESLQALKDLSWLARTHGAKVAVVQTWAWLDGKSSLWPTFESMQDDVNNATVSYMRDERQTQENIFLAPVGLAFEFVHDIIDLATYAHGQSQSATYTQRLIELVKNPYASILMLCKSKQSTVQSGLGSEKQGLGGTKLAGGKAAQATSPQWGMTSPAASGSGADEVKGFANVRGKAYEPAAAEANITAPAFRRAAVSGTREDNNTDKLKQVSDPAGSREATISEQPGVTSRALDSAALRTWFGQGRQDAVIKSKAGRSSPPVNVCLFTNLPAKNATFEDLYLDEVHPSLRGTYLQGLIITGAITGCRMLGNTYGFDLEPEWTKFLQALSDAIVFYGTPEQYPPYHWSKTGNVCSLLS